MANPPQPTFSVITANYNSGDKLNATAASVREQSTDAEHLILDGASTDGSLALARQLEANSPRTVRVISEPDRGVYDAMNKGVRAAAGRYLYFLGAGDVLRPGVLTAVAAALPSHDRGFIYGDVIMNGHAYDGPFDWRRLGTKNICHQAIFYGNQIFQELGNYDLKYRLLADYDFNLRCFGDRSIRTKYLPIVVADYEPGGISNGGDPVFMADFVGLLRRYYGPSRFARVRWDHFRAKARNACRRLGFGLS